MLLQRGFEPFPIACRLHIERLLQLANIKTVVVLDTRYELGSFAIAGNHVLVVPVAGIDLSEILHSWKSFTANAINRAQGRKGVLWQDESHDHLVRSEASLARITAYIHAHEDQGAYVEKRKL